MLRWSFLLLDSSDQPLGALDGVDSRNGGKADIVAQDTLGGSGSLIMDHRGQDIDWMNHRVQAIFHAGEKIIAHPEQGHWEGGESTWVVDVPESTIEHPAAVVYANDLTSPVTTGWTATLVDAAGSGATGAMATISGAAGTRVIRVSTSGTTTAVNPTASVRGQVTIATVPGATYTTTYQYKVVSGAAKARVSFGTAQGPETTSNVLSAGTPIIFTATGTSTDLVAEVYDNADLTATRNSVYLDVGDITVTQDAWTETIPEEGHWETSDKVWVVDSEASVEIIDQSWPVGTYRLTSPREKHNGTGLGYEIGLLTKMSIPAEDTVESRFSLAVGDPVIPAVVALLQSTGETRIAVTPSSQVRVSEYTAPAGTSKLKIINELLKGVGYWSLWCDGSGQFRVEPYVNPADRLPAFEFIHGEHSLHFPDWEREQDLSSVPNRITLNTRGDQHSGGLVGIAKNVDPASPYSFQSRGDRWIGPEAETVEADSQEVIDQLAARKLADAMNPVARLKVKHAMLDLNPNDLIGFTPEDGRRRLATIQRMNITFSPFTDIDAEWREVL